MTGESACVRVLTGDQGGAFLPILRLIVERRKHGSRKAIRLEKLVTDRGEAPNVLRRYTCRTIGNRIGRETPKLRHCYSSHVPARSASPCRWPHRAGPPHDWFRYIDFPAGPP